MSQSAWQRICALEPASTFAGSCFLGAFCWTFPQVNVVLDHDGMASAFLCYTIMGLLHVFIWSAFILPAMFVLHAVVNSRPREQQDRRETSLRPVRISHYHLGTCCLMMLIASVMLPAVLYFFMEESVRAGLCMTCIIAGATYIIGANFEWFMYHREQVHVGDFQL
jgi:hypothetical protein